MIIIGALEVYIVINDIFPTGASPTLAYFESNIHIDKIVLVAHPKIAKTLRKHKTTALMVIEMGIIIINLGSIDFIYHENRLILHPPRTQFSKKSRVGIFSGERKHLAYPCFE